MTAILLPILCIGNYINKCFLVLIIISGDLFINIFLDFYKKQKQQKVLRPLLIIRSVASLLCFSDSCFVVKIDKGFGIDDLDTQKAVVPSGPLLLQPSHR